MYKKLHSPRSSLVNPNTRIAFSFTVALIALRDTPPITDAVDPVAEGRGAAEPPALQALRQDDAEEVDGGAEGARDEGDEGVEDRAGVDVAAHAGPLDLALGLGERRRREPPHAEAERQRVADHEPRRVAPLHVAQRARAVGGAAVEHPAVVRMDVVLRRRVQQDVHVRADVQVAQLQGPGEREDERDVFLGVGLRADGLDVGGWSGRQTAG